MTSDQRPSGRQASSNAWLAYAGSAIALTGVQLIAPSLPVMRDALGLSDAQLAMVMSVYLLPSALAAIPLGILADRVGRRLVMGAALIGFGVCGALVPLVGGSYLAVLGVRLVQGVMFAGILPLSMTVLGDSFSGPRLVGAMGRRSVAMSLGDGTLPVIGGLLAGIAWFAPWLGQMVSIPIGAVVLAKLVDPPLDIPRTGGSVGVAGFLGLFRTLPIIGLQYAGFLRMFLKFSILTFLPLLLVDVRGLTPVFAGVVIGSAAITGTLVAAISESLSRLGRPTVWIGMGIAAMAVALVGMVLIPVPWAILICSLVYGAADGLMGVFTNALVAAATDVEQRASFVAATGAVRNFAKFMAPTAFGALTLVVPVTSAFVLVSAVTATSATASLLLRPLEDRLQPASEVSGP